jgi:hypothetical protein
MLVIHRALMINVSNIESERKWGKLAFTLWFEFRVIACAPGAAAQGSGLPVRNS